jgi:hypothetical protein
MNKYNLIYVINGKNHETLLTNQTASLCNHKKQEMLKTGRYKIGVLSIISSNGIKYSLKTNL